MPRKTLDEAYPELTKEWHPTKNGGVTPKHVTPGLDKKVWWKCPKGEDHEWVATIRRRVKGRGCHVCAGRKVVPSNSLASIYPQLAKEWHPTKNGDLTPEKIHYGSSKNVWWKCPEGEDHEWKASIHMRGKGVGCGVCSGKIVVQSTSLQGRYPKVAKEWHPTKNGSLCPTEVHCGSGKKVWWKCPKGDDHEWETSVRSRARGSGCPHCKEIEKWKGFSKKITI